MKLPIPADWDGESWCRWAICWPESEGWEGILRGFLTLPQRGWTWDERTGSILAVQETGREITAANVPLNGVIMACNDTEMTQAFSDIALALRYLADKQCCDNLQIDVRGGVQTIITSPAGVVTPIIGSEPPLMPEEGTFPEEFLTEAEYLLSKCQMAHYIADGVILALRRWSNLTIAEFTIGIIVVTLAVIGAIVFPPSAFPMLFVALGILGGVTGLLYEMANMLEAHRDEFVCLMYEGQNTSSVIGSLADFIDTIIALIPTANPYAMAIKVVAMVLINSDTINQLFDARSKAAYPTADCSPCGIYASRLNGGGAEIDQFNPSPEWQEVSSSDEGGYHLLALRAIGGDLTVEFQNLVGWTHTGEAENPNFALSQATYADIYTSPDDFATFASISAGLCTSPNEEGFNNWGMSSFSAFTVEIKITACS